MTCNMADESLGKNIKNKKRRPRPLAAILIILGLIFIIGVLGIYVFNSTNFFYRGLSRVIPYPAMLVDGDFVSYYQYADNVRAINRFLLQQEEAGISDTQLRLKVVERLVANSVLERLAKEEGVQIFDYEIEKEYQQAIDGLEEGNQAKESIERLFGWNVEQYKKNVIRPVVLERKLAATIYPDDSDAAGKFETYLLEKINAAKIIYFIPH